MRAFSCKLFILILNLFMFSTVFAEQPTLIPRDVLFSNPTKAEAQISPDGKWLTYLAPSNKGVLNIWLQDINQKKPAAMITHDKHRGIHHYFWAMNSQQVLYEQDFDGDENFHVYSANIADKQVRDLTPFQAVKANNIILDRDHPNEMLVGLNIRDRSIFDMYHVNLINGAVILDTQNPGNVTRWLADTNFQIRAAMSSDNETGNTTLQIRDDNNKPWRNLITWPFGENGIPVTFNKQGNKLTLISNLNADTSQLLEVDPRTGKTLKIIASNPKSDIDDVLVNLETYTLEAVKFNYLKPEWIALNSKINQDFAKLRQVHKGDFTIASRDKADKHWIIGYISDTQPGDYYLYDREKQQSRFLFTARPELAKYKLAEMQPITITARDKMQLVAYLTLPAGTKAENLPLVLNVHGGPWSRDSWGYNPEAQWLANRGYAVLELNFRGSTGFGKNYLNAGNLQWGIGNMQHDLTDAVKWAINKKIADPKRICIYGGSYGGYATLAGLTFTPELYACGIDVVGPSDLKTLLESIPPYWKNEKKQMILRIGDVEKDEALNHKLSPLYHVTNIRVPLLIAQGAHDPRVHINQAEMIVKAMRKKNLPVEYIVYRDEGHGFARPENRMDFYGRVEEFLGKYLKGRVQPWRKIEGNSAEVK